MRHSSFGRVGSPSSIGFHGIHAHNWMVASVLGLLTGCVEAPGVLTREPSAARFVAPDVALQLNRSAQPPGPAAPLVQMPVQENDFASLYSDTFWTALADLQLSALHDAARSKAEVGFAEGIAMLAAGDHQRAESTFVATSAQEVDLYVAVASHIMLATTLAYEHKWAALRDLSNNSRFAPVDRGSTAVLERWGRAFAGVEERNTTFAQEHVTLPLRLTAIGTPTVRVRINGKEYDFWLDTGSTMTVLSSDVAKDANVSVISADTLTIRTFAGTAPVKPGVVKRLEIGTVVISNSPAVVIAASLMRLRTSDGRVPLGGLQVDGIIGWDTIRQFDVSLDYRRGTITLRRPEILETIGTTAQNLIWLGKPFVEVRTKLGGILHFTLDTGAQSSFVNDATLKKANLTTRISQAQVFGIARTGALTGRVVPSLRLDIAGKWIELRSAVVYGSTSPGFINCDGILGSDIAQFGTVRIDATNGRFSIESGDAAE